MFSLEVFRTLKEWSKCEIAASVREERISNSPFMIVMKFGGSSVESATAIDRVSAIVKQHLSTDPIVVVSAIGKTTDRLLKMAADAANRNVSLAESQRLQLQADHLKVINELHLGSEVSLLTASVKSCFCELQQNLKEIAEEANLGPAMSDRVSSFGERLSSLIVTYALRNQGISARHLDARNVIVTDNNHTHASPLILETYTKVRHAVSSFPSSCVPVLGGFIGATPAGVPTTLGRGGSDYSAALVGAAIYAEEIQIWTDVDGMLTCDPRVLASGHCLKQISYAEAKQMACFGAKVLHPDTVSPAMRQNVPVSIRNSRNPNTRGTRIVDRPNSRPGVVKSIATKRDLCVFRVSPMSQPMNDDFASRVVNVFASCGVSVDLVSISQESVTIVHEATSQIEQIALELNRIGQTAIRATSSLGMSCGRGNTGNTRTLTAYLAHIKSAQYQGKSSGNITSEYCVFSS